MGDGGAVALRLKADAEKLRQLAQYGWAARYSVELVGGFNSRIDEVQAAVLVHRLGRLADENKKRREIVARYATSLPNRRRFLWSNGSDFVGHLAVMVTDQRDEDQKYLEEHGISTGIHYPIVDHHQNAWVQTFNGQRSPETELLNQKILTLPCFPALTDDEIQKICNALSNLPLL